MTTPIDVEFLLAGQNFVNSILDKVENDIDSKNILLPIITEFIEKCSHMGIYYKLDLDKNICFLEKFNKDLYVSYSKTDSKTLNNVNDDTNTINNECYIDALDGLLDEGDDEDDDADDR